MADPIDSKAASKLRSGFKNYLTSEFTRFHCEAGGSYGSCAENVKVMVDLIYNTAEYTIKLQKSGPGKPVSDAVIREFNARQMKALGRWAQADVVACSAAAVLFVGSLKTVGPAVLINAVLGVGVASGGLGIPLALRAWAHAAAGAALLAAEYFSTQTACAPLLESSDGQAKPLNQTPVVPPTPSVIDFLTLIEHAHAADPKSLELA